MYGDKVDLKNQELAKLLYWLRQYIDTHRVIGLHADFLNTKDAGGGYWAVSHRMALDSIAVTVCKIFERETMGYERNSIPGIIAEFEKIQSTDRESAVVRRYGEKNGVPNTGSQPAATLCLVLSAFKDSHAESFQRLKTYRDKFGSHSEHGFKPEKNLPSHDEFEAIFNFANGFYRMVSERTDVVPSPFYLQAEEGLVTVLKKVEIAEPKRQFPA